MNNKELLELAAKACGIEYWVVRFAPRSAPIEKLHITVNGETAEWNPLTNIADCANMEAHLEIDVVWEDAFVVTRHDGRIQFELYTDHDSPQSARMMASTKVAAEIGRRMSE